MSWGAAPGTAGMPGSTPGHEGSEQAKAGAHPGLLPSTLLPAVPQSHPSGDSEKKLQLAPTLPLCSKLVPGAQHPQEPPAGPCPVVCVLQFVFQFVFPCLFFGAAATAPPSRDGDRWRMEETMGLGRTRVCRGDLREAGVTVWAGLCER